MAQPYLLPGDANEAQRLDLQHHMIKEGFFRGRELVFAPINLQEPGLQVLDAAAGTGIWSVELADTSHPKTIFTLLDFNTKVCKASYPSLPLNVKLQEFDLQKDFEEHPEWNNHFDFINQRLLVFAFTRQQWINVLESYMRILKPGGCLQLLEFDLEDFKLGSAGARMLELCKRLTGAKGMLLNIAKLLPSLLEEVGFEKENITVQVGALDLTRQIPRYQGRGLKEEEDQAVVYTLQTTMAVIGTAQKLGWITEQELQEIAEGFGKEVKEAQAGKLDMCWKTVAVIAKKPE